MERSERTELLAKTAAYALCGINRDSGFGLADSRTSYLHTHAAVFAFIGIADKGDTGLFDDKCSGPAGNNNGKAVPCGFFTKHLFKLFYIKGINNADACNAH